MNTPDKVRVYQKPTCSKCRNVMQILSEQGVDFEAIDYMEQRLSAQELTELLRSAGISAYDAVRKNEPAYAEFVAGKDLSEEALISVMAQHPELLQRPIVVKGEKAVLARQPERLKDLGLIR